MGEVGSLYTACGQSPSLACACCWTVSYSKDVCDKEGVLSRSTLSASHK